MEQTQRSPVTENRHIEDRLHVSTEGRPHLLTLRIEGRPPTWNQSNKAHPKTRSQMRNKWKAATLRALGVALAYDGIPTVPDELADLWAKSARADRERLLREHEVLQARCFAHTVHVEARPQYQSGRSVPDPDGIGAAVKWALDAIVKAGCLVTDSRHHVSGHYYGAALIAPDGGPESLRLQIESDWRDTSWLD